MGILNLVPEVSQLTDSFGQAAAPTFFLFATAAFIDRMNTRLVLVESQVAQMKQAGEHANKDQMTMLRKRAIYLRRGIHSSVWGGIFAIVLLVELFAALTFGWKHAYGAALLFVTATVNLGLGLTRFALEARLALLNPE